MSSFPASGWCRHSEAERTPRVWSTARLARAPIAGPTSRAPGGRMPTSRPAVVGAVTRTKLPGAQSDSLDNGILPPGSWPDCHSDVISSCLRSGISRVHQAHDPLQIVHRTELDHDLALAFSQADCDAGVEGARQLLGNVLQARHLDRLAPRRRRLAGVAAVGESDRLFGCPHRQPFG